MLFLKSLKHFLGLAEPALAYSDLLYYIHTLWVTDMLHVLCYPQHITQHPAYVNSRRNSIKPCDLATHKEQEERWPEPFSIFKGLLRRKQKISCFLQDFGQFEETVAKSLGNTYEGGDLKQGEDSFNRLICTAPFQSQFTVSGDKVVPILQVYGEQLVNGKLYGLFQVEKERR